MATIYDVAKAAGVSPKTVTRVINRDAPVGVATRAKVEAAIADLGYVPSLAARTLRSNRSGLVGLITGAISLTPLQSDESGLPDLFIVQGIQKAMAASGKTLLIADTGGQMERVPQLMSTFEQHKVEGIIYVAAYHQQVSLPGKSESTKLVLANCFDDNGTPAVVPHDYQGQRQLTEGLIAKGHRRIAHLTLNPGLVAAQLRLQGYCDALAAAGIDYDEALVAPVDLFIPDAETELQLLWDALDRILSLPNRPTVLCFGNDRMALRAYGVLRSRGVELPKDVSVAGYDNYRMITETLYPPLTSVELPYLAMGINATRLLLGLIDGTTKDPSEPQRVSGPIIWRDSVVARPQQLTSITSLGRMP